MIQDRRSQSRLLSTTVSSSNSGHNETDQAVDNGANVSATTDTDTDTDTTPLPSKRRVDPMARRPTVKCDPYGQGGKPMSSVEAEALLFTLHSDWTLLPLQSAPDNKNDKNDAPPHSLERTFVHSDFLQGAALVQTLAAVAVVNNHFPARITLERRIVRKQWQVVTRVHCHTVVLGGLSTHDFHLAMVSRSLQYRTLCTSKGRVLSTESHNPVIALHIFFFFHQQLMDVEVDRPQVKKLYLLAEV